MNSGLPLTQLSSSTLALLGAASILLAATAALIAIIRPPAAAKRQWPPLLLAATAVVLILTWLPPLRPVATITAIISLLISGAIFSDHLLILRRQQPAATSETAVSPDVPISLQNRFQPLMDAAPSGILLLNHEGIITLANLEAAHIFGYTTSEMRGMVIEELIPNRYHSIHKLHRHNYNNDMRTRSMGTGMSLVGRRRNGEEFFVEVGLGVIEIAPQTTIISFVRDITPRKAIEAQRDQQAHELARSNDELEQFAYVVSHDLRAPLRALSTYSQFLLEDSSENLNEEGLDYVNGITENAHRMNQLVQGLLDYSRIGRVGVEKHPVNIGDVLQRIINSLHVSSPSTIEIAADPPTVIGYELRLEQIFSNLLENAAKFKHPDRPATIQISWADRGRAWTFSVKDNGIGIDPKQNEKIFGIFQRLHAQEEYVGTGVGLAIVKKAVEEHGGQIWVNSEPGKGSVFTFTLPK